MIHSTSSSIVPLICLSYGLIRTYKSKTKYAVCMITLTRLNIYVYIKIEKLYHF